MTISERISAARRAETPRENNDISSRIAAARAATGGGSAILSAAPSPPAVNYDNPARKAERQGFVDLQKERAALTPEITGFARAGNTPDAHRLTALNKEIAKWGRAPATDTQNKDRPFQSGLTFGESQAYGGLNILQGAQGFGNAILKAPGTALYGLGAGASGLFGKENNKAYDWFANQAKINNEIDVFGAEKTEQLIEEKYGDKLTQSDRNVGGIVQSGTSMLGSLAVGNAIGAASTAASAGTTLASTPAITSAAASKAALGASAGQSSAEQAMAEGATAEQAAYYGLLSGALEVAVESIAGGVPGLGQGATGKVLSKLGQSGLLKSAIDIIGEGGEEVLTEFLQPYLQRLIYNPQAENATLEEMASAFKSGVALSLMMQGGNLAANKLANVGNQQTSTAPQQQDTPLDNFKQTERAINPSEGVVTTPQAESQQGATQGLVEPTAAIEPMAKPEAVASMSKEEFVANPPSGYKYKPSSSTTTQEADADTTNGVINLTDKFFDLSPDSRKFVLAHELNHFKSEAVTSNPENTELMQAIWGLTKSNPNTKYFVEKNVDEVVTELLTDYQETPEWLQSKYPEFYNIAKNISEGNLDVTQYGDISKYIPAYKQYPDTPDGNSLQMLDDVIATNPELAKSKGWDAKAENLRKKVFPENSLGAKITQQLPQGLGAMSPQFAYQEAVNQQHSTDTAFTEAERQMEGLRHEDSTHAVLTDVEAAAKAQERLSVDYKGEKAELATRQDWDKTDTTMAHMVLRDLVADARGSGDYSEVVKWNKVLETQKSLQGQALQANRQFAATPEKVAADAADLLNGKNVRKLSDRRKAEIINTAYAQAEALANIQTGDTASLIELIKQNSVIRRTTGMFSKNTSKALDSALSYYAANFDGAEATLRAVAEAQSRNIATDYTKLSPLEAIKSYRIQGMLSKATTIMRNLFGNTSFDLIDSIANNSAVPVDALVSLVTGTRAVPVDQSWASQAKRRGAVEGFLSSYIQVALDADATGGQSKYETRTGRTFKMTGSPLERLLSTWAKFSGYALETTDEFAKGGVRGESQRGIDKLKSKGLVAEDALTDRPQEMALQRTFQNDSKARRVATKAKDAANVIGVTDAQGGTFGLGDLGMPFVGVPSNLVSQVGNYSPVGLANGIRQLGKVMKQAKVGNLSADAQAEAVTNIGRGLTGTGLIAALGALAYMGIIRVAGDDDKDKEALERAEGGSGIQLNTSALIRMAEGGSAKWQRDDALVNVGFLEPLNGQMAIGAMLADELKESGKLTAGSIVSASLSGTIEALLDLPAMSLFDELVNGYRYSKGETTGEKAADTALNYAASQASSLVPNFVGGIASSVDGMVRSAYTGDKWYEKAADSFKSRLPLARETLPASLDPLGRERKANTNPLLHALNQNVLPGAITTYQGSEVSQELERLDAETAGGAKYPNRKAPNKVGDYKLTASDKDAFQRTAGQTYANVFQSMLSSTEYGDLSSEEQASITSSVNSFAQDKAKRELAENRGEEYSSDWDKVHDLSENELAVYLAYKQAMKSATSTNGENAEAIEALADDYRKMPYREQVQLDELLGSSFDKLIDVVGTGVDTSTYFKYKEQLTGDAKSKTQVRSTILNSSTLNSTQQKTLYSALFSDTYYDKYEKYGKGAGADAAKFVDAVAYAATSKKDAAIDYAQRKGLTKEQINALCESQGWKKVY